MQNYRDALKAVVIPATARRAEHSLAASSQIRMLASVKGLLTHANGIGYASFNLGKGVAPFELTFFIVDKRQRVRQFARIAQAARCKAKFVVNKVSDSASLNV